MWIRFYFPSLVYLVIVAATGSLLRFQWTAPEYSVFNAQYLIHAHSHVAILGWLFLVLCGLLLEYGMQKKVLRVSRRTVFSILVQITVVGMLVSFTLEGYGLASIAFSSVHILISYYFALIYFRYERININPVVRNYYNAAVFWMILSSLGPWFLAAGRGLTPFWLDTGISFYLHLQFNGWFLFFLAGFSYQFLINPYYRSRPQWGQWPFVLMFLGLLPSMIPMLDITRFDQWLVIVGSAGTLAFTIGSAMVLWLAWKSRGVVAVRGAIGLYWFALVGGVVKTAMQGATAWPQVVSLFLGSHYIVIGFIHLLLLGFISSALLFILSLKYKKSLMSKTWLAGSLTYQVGTGGMLLLLFGIGLMQVSGTMVYFNFQLWLLLTGVITLFGVTMMTISLSVGKQAAALSQNRIAGSIAPLAVHSEKHKILIP